MRIWTHADVKNKVSQSILVKAKAVSCKIKLLVAI